MRPAVVVALDVDEGEGEGGGGEEGDGEGAGKGNWKGYRMMILLVESVAVGKTGGIGDLDKASATWYPRRRGRYQ